MARGLIGPSVLADTVSIVFYVSDVSRDRIKISEPHF